jgi:poly-gamma-glutamate synthesis protein (capsule biosynthesis protein)
VLTLANNHAFDLGVPGVLATRDGARAAGFATAGSGADSAEAASWATLRTAAGTVAVFAFDLGPQADMVYARPQRAGINPLRVHKRLRLPPADLQRFAEIARAVGQQERMARRIRVGYSDAPVHGSTDFFGLELCGGEAVAEEYYPDAADLKCTLEGIGKAAREQGTRVVVSLHHHHWDPDWRAAPDWLVSLCAQLADAGAAVVFCHGSPVLQGMGLHRGRPVFYGLGNFIFHTARAARYDANGIDVWRSLVSRCDFDAEGRVQRVALRPIRVGLPSDKTPQSPLLHGPALLGGDEAKAVLEGFLDRSALADSRISMDSEGCLIQPR